MAGLTFRTGLNVSSGPGTSQPATTASQAAFGGGYSPTNKAGMGVANLAAPNDPASIAMWAGIAGLGGLAFLYRSLPSGRRGEFQLVLMMMVLYGLAKGPAKMSLQRIAQDAGDQSIINDLARAGLWVLN